MSHLKREHVARGSDPWKTNEKQTRDKRTVSRKMINNGKTEE